MNFGVVMLVHTALERVAQVVRFWADGGCPVVVHVDAKVPGPDFDALRAEVADLAEVRFSRRHRCDWGQWGIVRATQDAAEMLLAEWPELGHVYLASGSCLPLRPVSELGGYLAAHEEVDFIESVTTAEVPWTMGGLDKERFTLRFPFNWRTQRRAFDWYVEFQRRYGLTRRLPQGLVPHMGSQWWCLTRQTLESILTDPRRPEYDRYFRRVWIPDESYFQSLARLWARQIESRSLTLSYFDTHGKPHVFYDDHLPLLQRSECFVARKIWHRAEGLYGAFLSKTGPAVSVEGPRPGRVERIFAQAVTRRKEGRKGLYSAGRFPRKGGSAAPYSVFQGFDAVFDGFEPWLARTTETQVHGHLFSPKGAAFYGGGPTFAGALSAAPALRDYNPRAFLHNLLWTTRARRQCFQFGPEDAQAIAGELAYDPNAQINVITGAWALELFKTQDDFAALRARGAELQAVEAAFLAQLRSHWVRADVNIWSLAEAVETPLAVLQASVGVFSTTTLRHPVEAPDLVDLTGFFPFLRTLKNQGMHPYLVGDIAAFDQIEPPAARPAKPYIVR